MESVLEHPMLFTVGLAFAASISVLLITIVLRNFLYISRPHEALVVSGGGGTGRELGYEVVSAGQSRIVIPILNQVRALDVRLVLIEISVRNAYSSGNIPLRIDAIANVKVNTSPSVIHNAIERFAGSPAQIRSQIQDAAQQTLEGALREVLAKLTPEEVNEDRLKFAEMLSHSAASDMEKLGLELDTLKILHVADDTGYLDSLGRPRIAAVLRDAENAENQAMQETAQAQALASQRAEIAKAQAETVVLQKRNELRRVKAELEGNAQAVEREAEAASKTARAEAERELQTLRSALEHKRLQADVVIPAETHRQAQALLAKGEAAPVIENGAAAVEVLRAMSTAWQDMGPQAKEIYVIQHLDQILGTVLSRLKEFEVGEVNVLDAGDGNALASYAASYPQMVGAVMRALKDTTGVDVPAILNREGSSGGAR